MITTARKIYETNREANPSAFNISQHVGRKVWANQYFTCYEFADKSRYAVGNARKGMEKYFKFVHYYILPNKIIEAIGHF